MALTGNPKPTFHYSRIKYGTPAVTIDFDDPCAVVSHPQQIIAGENLALSGAHEVLFLRQEDVIRFTTSYIGADLAYAIRRFFETHGGRGKTFEFWRDRFSGSCWLFQDDLKDQNDLALTLSSGSTSYAVTAMGRGLDLISGTQYLSVPLAQASAATPTGYDDPIEKSEGVIVLDLKPSFASSDGTLRTFFDTSGATNRIRLYKTAANVTVFEVLDSAGATKSDSVSFSWIADARVRFLCKWSTAGVELWYYSTSWTQAGSPAGSGTGTLTTLPTTLYLGADLSGGTRAPGIYDTFAIYKKAFAGGVGTTVALGDYRLSFRNYLQKAILIPRTYEPPRTMPARELYSWSALLRKGL